ncbi:hypothetical protein DY000_02045944 [Brassica cretica]|uniref:Neprosin domain-containing protein n=1 Tax=Brassica cretica TaxID=69181 RepID=A0ABQ7EV35_BRACR|nr:hypothetical protein DY000_02045944 [Brassica cretica]
MLVNSLRKMKYWNKNGYYAYYHSKTISLPGFINPVAEIQLGYYNGYGALLHGGTGGRYGINKA